jgi:hypothetical protein
VRPTAGQGQPRPNPAPLAEASPTVGAFATLPAVLAASVTAGDGPGGAQLGLR